jgi:predicted nucleic-acid-binding Zn-ribbon protein
MGLFDAPEPVNVEVKGNILQCLVCGHQKFWRREAQLHTAAATFFQVEWTNPTALCYVCDNCGYIHWFLPQ